MRAPTNPYRGHRFPGEIISEVVWLYFRLSVSYHEVEEMMARRGVQLTYETAREWCGKFGSHFAEELRRRNKWKLGSKWYLDEVFLKINSVQVPLDVGPDHFVSFGHTASAIPLTYRLPSWSRER